MLIEVELDNDEKLYFVFENKLETSYHSNQLARHIEEGKKNLKGEIKYIYFKLGYMYQEDLELPEKSYTIIDRGMILEVFNEINIENDTFKSYMDYLLKLELKYQEEDRLFSIKRQLEYSELESIFYSSSSQYKVLKRLNKPLGNKRRIARGSSYGRPWSNMPLIWFDKEDEWFGIFWRIDWRKNNSKEWYPYICLRSYKTTKITTELDNNYLHEMREIFNEVSEKFPNLEFGKVHNSGVKEREIGILFFDNEKNTVSEITSSLVEFTNKFIVEVNQRKAYYKELEEWK